MLSQWNLWLWSITFSTRTYLGAKTTFRGDSVWLCVYNLGDHPDQQHLLIFFLWLRKNRGILRHSCSKRTSMVQPWVVTGEDTSAAGVGWGGFPPTKVMVSIGGSMRKDLNQKQGMGRLESWSYFCVRTFFFFEKIYFFGASFVGFTAEPLDEDILNPERIPQYLELSPRAFIKFLKEKTIHPPFSDFRFFFGEVNF